MCDGDEAEFHDMNRRRAVKSPVFGPTSKINTPSRTAETRSTTPLGADSNDLPSVGLQESIDGRQNMPLSFG